ncbi:hypothetical protein H6G80_30570 [Nostoc sp. FACHB-87]|uniref:hypothetical protein n=1 Tax=Nostocaceae TaxID=1162 RepID=UPI001689EC23|nr:MULTISPECIES: hypothetical protein [Nostocaceae]MBD2458398.1 hypothetical protein [Nostoc sp. FACHB-87]MBD2479506.1 hypothetical protein [Anabaena sp. FACHB-83]
MKKQANSELEKKIEKLRNEIEQIIIDEDNDEPNEKLIEMLDLAVKYLNKAIEETW